MIGELFSLYKGLIVLTIIVTAAGIFVHKRACLDTCRGCGKLRQVNGTPSLCKTCRRTHGPERII